MWLGAISHQSSNISTLSHTCTQQRVRGDRAVPTALPLRGRGTLAQITCCRGQWQSASSRSSPRTQAHTHVHTHVDSRLGFTALIDRHLIQGGEEVACMLSQMWGCWPVLLMYIVCGVACIAFMQILLRRITLTMIFTALPLSVVPGVNFVCCSYFSNSIERRACLFQ